MNTQLELRRLLTVALLFTVGSLILSRSTPAWGQESPPRVIPPPSVNDPAPCSSCRRLPFAADHPGRQKEKRPQ